ncbi:MAG TPA: M23 family metallopeptidase [Allocoleopsis sp.]
MIKKRLSWLILSAMVAGIVTFASAVLANQLQFIPNNPRLGDGISVILKADQPPQTNPTISVEKKTYPTFPIGNDQFRGFLPTSPLEKPRTLSIEINNNGEIIKQSLKLTNRSFPVQRITLPKGKAGVDATELELRRVKETKNLLTPEKYWNGRFIPPNKSRMSSGYGIRRYYNGVFAKDYYHRGIDYAGGYGSPVTAPAPGKIVLVGKEKEGFRVHGNIVGMDHGQGVISLFLHLSKINVKEGDFVQTGKVIGAIGSTGASTGPHLHWGFFVNAVSVDPIPWLSQSIE